MDDDAVGAAVDDVTDQRVERARLVSALRELPENPRVAVVLRHVVGLSYMEIAEAQGCPVGTVKAQVSRGIGSLRQLMDAKDPPTREVLK
ncbi:sigma-70 family RNA polymerase sigma factor [Streptomyces sp. 5.8]|uniref:sigma-70 family RNA polymerase sigma factor n=1 Tax=Streptomyces sp. 5.8 TaxID=3406571 RepID=UPI003BB79D40